MHIYLYIFSSFAMVSLSSELLAPWPGSEDIPYFISGVVRQVDR